MKGLATASTLGIITFHSLSTLPSTYAFISSPTRIQRTTTASASLSSTLLHAGNAEPFELMVDLPGGKDLSAKMKFPAVLDVPSEMIEVRYKLPFGLDVAPKNNLAVCTKDGVSLIRDSIM